MIIEPKGKKPGKINSGGVLVKRKAKKTAGEADDKRSVCCQVWLCCVESDWAEEKGSKGGQWEEQG